MMNSPIVRAYAEGLAKRVHATSGDTPADNVRRAYAIAIGRGPSAEEEADAIAFLAEQAQSYGAAEKANASEFALTDFCQTLMSLNEFVFID
jgi:hypothetical protein